MNSLAAEAQRYAASGSVRKNGMVSQSKCQMEPGGDWSFDQAPNVAAISTRQVMELDYPILLVTHYEDDDSWAFLCGTTEDYAKDGRVIGMAEALSRDQTLRSLADLPPGWSAWRDDKDSEWIRHPETTA